MPPYVNRDAIRDAVAPVEAETDPLLRMQMMREVAQDFLDRMTAQVSRTCLELKAVNGWNAGQVADATGLSERMVKRLISSRAMQTGVQNPLRRRDLGPYVDISDMVRVRR